MSRTGIFFLIAVASLAFIFLFAACQPAPPAPVIQQDDSGSAAAIAEAKKQVVELESELRTSEAQVDSLRGRIEELTATSGLVGATPADTAAEGPVQVTPVDAPLDGVPPDVALDDPAPGLGDRLLNFDAEARASLLAYTGGLWGLLLTIGVVGLLGLLGLRSWQRLDPDAEDEAENPEAATAAARWRQAPPGFYAALLRALAAAGFHRRPDHTPRELARDVRRARGPAASSAAPTAPRPPMAASGSGRCAPVRVVAWTSAPAVINSSAMSTLPAFAAQ